jgi:FAD/FMN-containing dehydrogenase/Fe-S oxidoreductase
VDEQPRGRIRDDLKGIIKGELLFDDPMLSLYSTDASIFQVKPLGVVVPRDEDDVEALVRYAGEAELPLIARGAGTGMAGESLGRGLIVDLSRNFRHILEIGSDFVRLQPGVVYRTLNEQLAKVGRRFAPNPASGDVCTIGGMLANNASGSHVLRHGYTRDHVESLRVVLDSGDIATVGKEPWPPRADLPGGHLLDILNALGVLLEQNRELIATHGPRIPFNRCGYLLHDVLISGQWSVVSGQIRSQGAGVRSQGAGVRSQGSGDNGQAANPDGSSLTTDHPPLTTHLIDVARLLVGSEGTLALFTEATLRTMPLPEGRSLVLISFASLEAALRGARKILDMGPTACDLLDRRLLGLIRANEGALLAQMVPAAAEAVLLVEFEAGSAVECRNAAHALAAAMGQFDPHFLHAAAAVDEPDLARIKMLRDSALPSLYGQKSGVQPLPFIEDIGVPIDCMPEFMRRAQELLQEQETTASFLIHACTGQIHTRPFLDLQRSADVSKLIAMAENFHALALELGGTVSTQHGTGLARTPWVARQAGPLYPLMRQLKAIFDPKNIFNPGKIVDPEPSLASWPLRTLAPSEKEIDKETRRGGEGETLALPLNPVSPSPPLPVSPSPGLLVSPSSASAFQLRWQPDELRLEANHCNGCGECRSEAPSLRMCPLFRATQAEAATPRAKANLVRNLLQHTNSGQALAADQVRAVADLCINCKMCAIECPAHVNIPKLMLETKAANVAEHGLDRSRWFFARLETWAKIGSFFPVLTNLALRTFPLRWLVDKVIGLSCRRRLPTLARTTFLKQAVRQGWTTRPDPAKPCVALFVDVFGNYFDPLLAEAAVAVLRHNGFNVFVPPGQGGCGMSALAQGDVENVTELSQRNLRALAEVARDGMPIVCLEPTSALMFRQDLLDLLDDSDARTVARQTVLITHFLAELHRQGKLRTDLQHLELELGHHVPCHAKAIGQDKAGPALLGLIPNLRVHTIDVSCSGMAGTFGLESRSYAASLAAGKPMLDELARPSIAFGSTECSACRVQMEDVARKRTLHPVQYLALAYGLLPQIAQQLRPPKGTRVLR